MSEKLTDDIAKLREFMAKACQSATNVYSPTADQFAFTVAILEAAPGLLDRIESLSAWKAEQLAVEATWDVQAVGKAIGLPLGSNIRTHILPYIESLSKQLAAAQKLVEVQAKDSGLWFAAEYNSEAYLQKALRKLHAAVEGKPS